MKERINYADWLQSQRYEPTSIQRLLSIQGKAMDYIIQGGLRLNSEALKSFVRACDEAGYSGAYRRQIHWAVTIYGQYLKAVQGKSIKLQLPKLQVNTHRRKALPASAIAHLEKWLSEQQKDYWLKQCLWCLFYGAGLRRKEALNLQLKNFDLGHRLLSVHTLKTGAIRALPLSQRQTGALLNYIKYERPLSQDAYDFQFLLGRKGGNAQSLLGAQLKLWQEETGLGSALSWHALRHTIATNLVERGMSIEQVGRFLGHKNIASTSRYLHYLESKHKTDEL
jgi:site-specific recombinase XerD